MKDLLNRKIKRRESFRPFAPSVLAEKTGVFGETAPGVTLGALRTAVERGEIRSSDRVVLLVTGDGLKTPEHVSSRLRPVEIDPDADAVLDELAAA